MFRVSKVGLKTLNLRDGVTAQIGQLNVGDYLRAFAILTPHIGKKGVDATEIAGLVLQNADSVRAILDIVPRYVRNLNGIEIENDDASIRPATSDDLVAHPTLVPFALIIFIELFSHSALGESERKNSADSPAGS